MIEDEPQLAPYQVPRDEEDGEGSILDDQEPIVAPLESYAEFREGEDQELSALVCSLTHFSEDGKFQEEEPHVSDT
jgi:hypothetical protein